MRVKTDERRNAIIQAATEVFAKVGYERASMAMIADRAGSSKTTLYGYFPSKEELFWGAMTGAMPEQGEKTLQLIDPPILMSRRYSSGLARRTSASLPRAPRSR